MATTIRLKDAIQKPLPNAVRLKGLIGARFDGSRVNRLAHQEEDHLLWPFREHCAVGFREINEKHPGIRGDWQGEFMGTWVDAAVLSAWNAGDEALRRKVDGMVRDWLAAQAADGYLGTYDEPDRWESWDVWVQAHDMIGLLSYHRYTGSKEALDAAVRVADRVLVDFGPGKRRVSSTGPHMGMASSAILEPMMWIYRETGDEKYLNFGLWLVEQDWESEGGPQIMSAILSGRGVAGTANSKGIEMLIDFTGLVELYRSTGEEKYLNVVTTAWEDIVNHHLYVTGSASTGEYFPKDFALRNDGVYMIGETCVSMGWLYLNLSLGRLTGDAKYFDMAEQTLYNHLMAAQSPDGRAWIYYLGLRDSKRYRWHTDPECCPSRGVRAIAQMPTHAFGLTEDGLVVNFYDAADASLPMPSGQKLRMHVESQYPFDGAVALTLDPEKAEEFTLRLRLPGWCSRFSLKVAGQPVVTAADEKGYLVLKRRWASGDRIELDLEMAPAFTVDTIGNNGRVAVTRGPLVYALDTSYLPGGVLLDDVLLALPAGKPGADLQVVKQGETGTPHVVVDWVRVRPEVGEGFWREKERYQKLSACAAEETVEQIELVPFFEAGNRDPKNYRDGINANSEPVRSLTFQVWLPYRCR